MRKHADVICISLHALLASVSKPSHSSSSSRRTAYISLSISLSFALLFLENVCRRLGWMRLRCLSLMPEEGKGAHALDLAQLRWERVWMCGRNPCSQSLLSLSCQCSSLVVKMEDVRVTVVRNFLFLVEVVFQSSGSVYRMAFLGKLHFLLSNKSSVLKLQMQAKFNWIAKSVIFLFKG